MCQKGCHIDGGSVHIIVIVVVVPFSYKAHTLGRPTWIDDFLGNFDLRLLVFGREQP